ncbi:recombinase family protein [Sphingomonas sp. ID0503]|uniref:recombinase family protein n=1 Tax=Sphingomonas sp. ID0503 TaxID=3399691 RepID=UPI003AFAD978
MRAVIYARYSTDHQDPLSIDTQLTMCRSELARRGWVEVGTYTDAAKSGATMHREGLQAMLAAVSRGGVDLIFADAMDRLSRSQADIAMLYERLRFRNVLLVTRKEGEVTALHVGMAGTINAQQITATSEKTRDALTMRHAQGKNPGGNAFGYEKRIAYGSDGERIKGLQQIVPAQAETVVRIFQEFAAGLSPGQIVRSLNAEGVPPPRSGKRDKTPSIKPPAWSPNTLTGNAERGTGILNDVLYTGWRPYLKQTYRKNPDSGKRHAFVRSEEDRPDLVAAPELRIVSDTLWQAVKDRQAQLARGSMRKTDETPALPFFAQQRPKYLLTGKATCGECGASYAKSGAHRFGCQGSAKKGPSYCSNRLTIRQDDLDARVLEGLTREMLRDDVLAIFLEEYEAETRRLDAVSVTVRPEREVALSQVTAQLTNIKAAILQGVNPTLFVDELRQLTERQTRLTAEIAAASTPSSNSDLLHPDLGRIYREKVAKLTKAFEDEALKAEAFERIRALIDAVVLTPEDGELKIDLRGELASMLELCACPEMRTAPTNISERALQIKLVAGTGFEPVTFRL